MLRKVLGLACAVIALAVQGALIYENDFSTRTSAGANGNYVMAAAYVATNSLDQVPEGDRTSSGSRK